MNCGQCQGIETVFDQKTVAQKLKKYRTQGPDKTTHMLIDALKAQGVEGATLLDIGGGVGAIQHELLKQGARSATDVEASSAYLTTAKAEAERQGLADRVTYRYGNFVDIAPDVEPADIVTLDRVICCYHDMEKLVGLSSARARRTYGLVYPRDTWWMRIGLAIGNVILRLSRSSFRSFAHSTKAVDAVIRGNGLKQKFYRRTFLWQVVVYAR
jgi:magnesium-protoporphyrin O-methyltransferase